MNKIPVQQYERTTNHKLKGLLNRIEPEQIQESVSLVLNETLAIVH